MSEEKVSREFYRCAVELTLNGAMLQKQLTKMRTEEPHLYEGLKVDAKGIASLLRLHGASAATIELVSYSIQALVVRGYVATQIASYKLWEEIEGMSKAMLPGVGSTSPANSAPPDEYPDSPTSREMTDEPEGPPDDDSSYL